MYKKTVLWYKMQKGVTVKM